ncbi:hypothetical protein GON26_00770 [Flavobacterium sp. GA093]|uniref:Uncharacterized protein n=1 Tax=Flavobacterium hydrocarbonoxydans TaxID=2683249 RepID=A0A6I4NP61_9FLAO|nr:hypothetical protein [Flavobacterium hydrocarbonoxydans]MWB92887.1 hypothetical protein [Flavobacterium hydrocarbonoxydans]
MKQNIKIPFSEKFNYTIFLLFSFGTPIIIASKYDLENRLKSIMIMFILLYFLGFYCIFKIYQYIKSSFFECTLTIEKKEIIIEKLGEEKYFKNLPKFEKSIIRMHYKKYALGLDYEINFYLTENQIEFNAFCNQRSGIFDFGTRKRILKKINEFLKQNCTAYSP